MKLNNSYLGNLQNQNVASALAQNHSRKSSNQTYQTNHSKKMSNRSVLRDQNQKLKSEVHILQQALVNLSLNDININNCNSSKSINAKGQSTGQYMQTNQSSSQSQLLTSFGQQQHLQTSQMESCGYFNIPQQNPQNNPNYHQKLYQQLVSQAQLSNYVDTEKVISPAATSKQEIQVLNNQVNNLNINNSSFQTPTSNNLNHRDFNQDSATKYQSLQNREYIKQRVSNIIKDATNGAANTNKSSHLNSQTKLAKENQFIIFKLFFYIYLKLLAPPQNNHGILNEMYLKVSNSSPYKKNQGTNNLHKQQVNQSFTSSKQAQGFEINTNSSLHNSVLAITPQLILDHQNQDCSDISSTPQSQYAPSSLNIAQNLNQSSSNDKYHHEIENLKKILLEIGQKEHEMIDKMNGLESNKVEALEETTFQIENDEDKAQFYIRELEVRDQQLIEAQQHIETQDEEISQLKSTINDLQIELNGSQIELLNQQQKIENQSKQNSLLINEVKLLKEENMNLKQKPKQSSAITQTCSKEVIDAKVNTDFEQLFQPTLMEMTAERQLDFTLNQNLNQGTAEKNFANSTITSPKNQSSYMQTPTRSALQQFIYNSSAKKNDEFYISHIFNRSSVIKDALANQSQQFGNSRNKNDYDSQAKVLQAVDKKSVLGMPPLNQQNLQCNVQNKMSSQTQLSSFITKPSFNISTVIEEKILPPKERSACKTQKRSKNLDLLSPQSNEKQRNKDITLRCPGQRDTSVEDMNKSSYNVQRTPQNQVYYQLFLIPRRQQV